MQNNSGAIDLTKIGLLAPGANPLTPSDEKGINEILRGRVHLNDGSSVTTFVKLLSKKQLINELFGAELARAVGMPVPEVFWFELINATTNLYLRNIVFNLTALCHLALRMLE
jgi:hypothetical protein